MRIRSALITFFIDHLTCICVDFIEYLGMILLMVSRAKCACGVGFDPRELYRTVALPQK